MLLLNHAGSGCEDTEGGLSLALLGGNAKLEQNT